MLIAYRGACQSSVQAIWAVSSGLAEMSCPSLRAHARLREVEFFCCTAGTGGELNGGWRAQPLNKGDEEPLRIGGSGHPLSNRRAAMNQRHNTHPSRGTSAVEGTTAIP